MASPTFSWLMFLKAFGVIGCVALLLMGAGAMVIQPDPLVQGACLAAFLVSTAGLSVWVTLTAATPAPAAIDAARRAKALESQHAQAAGILESLVDGVCAVDRGGQILWLNGAAQRLLGMAGPPAPGARLVEHFKRPEVETLITDVIRTQKPASCDVRIPGQPERVLRFQAAPGAFGALETAIVLLVQDVTESREREGRRQAALRETTESLKGPLTSVTSLVETLLAGALDDPANSRQVAAKLKVDTMQLTRLVDALHTRPPD